MILRIAIFTDSFCPQINGVSNTLKELSHYLTRNGHPHLFFAPDYEIPGKDDTGYPAIRFRGAAPRIYPDCRLAFPSLSRIMEGLEAFKPDVVHIVTELGIGLAGLRAARALNLPVVMSYHTSFDKYLKYYRLQYLSRPLWAYMRWFHSFALLNLAPSRSTLSDLGRAGMQDLALWPRGIDLKRFNPGRASLDVREALGGTGKTIFLYVGRIAVEKGLDNLADSIDKVNAVHGQDILWVFTGEGPYLPELIERRIPNAVFTGSREGEELAAIYASADAFIFPSGTETFGNVVLEAMASGLPVICTNSGGVTDFTEDGRNALVTPFGDANAMAEVAIRLLDPRLRAELGSGALETARARSWDSVFHNLLSQYQWAANPAWYAEPRITG